MVEFYLLTFPRLPLRKKEHKSYFGKSQTHDFRTSRCAGYLLDHSDDDGLNIKTSGATEGGGGGACVCVCVIDLHITAQSGPIILVILCHLH